VNSTLQLVTSQFFMVKPAVFGYLSTLSRLRWGLLEVQWAKLRLVRKWTRNLLGKSWGNGLSEVYIYIFFQHSVFFSSHHMGWSENWATPQDHASTANHHVSPKHRYVVAIISPIPSPLHGLQHSAADGIPPNVLAALP